MVCAACGKPMDATAKFCSNCGSALNGGAYYGVPYSVPGARLMRSRTQRMIAGVCGGFAEHYGWDVGIVRLVTAVCLLFGGLPLLAYVIAWIVLPEAPLVMPQQQPVTPGPTGATAS